MRPGSSEENWAKHLRICENMRIFTPIRMGWGPDRVDFRPTDGTRSSSLGCLRRVSRFGKRKQMRRGAKQPFLHEHRHLPNGCVGNEFTGADGFLHTGSPTRTKSKKNATRPMAVAHPPVGTGCECAGKRAGAASRRVPAASRFLCCAPHRQRKHLPAGASNATRLSILYSPFGELPRCPLRSGETDFWCNSSGCGSRIFFGLNRNPQVGAPLPIQVRRNQDTPALIASPSLVFLLEEQK